MEPVKHAPARMKIAALSEASGFSVPTLKFYLREGLLPAGRPTRVNQAEYGDAHLRRLRLIRALTELGGLGLADVRRVLAAVDDEDQPLHDTFGVAQDALAARAPTASAAASAAADGLIARHGLRVRPGAEVRARLAEALDALVAFELCGPGVDHAGVAAQLDPLVPDAAAHAEAALATVPAEAPRGEQLLVTVVGTVAWGAALDALRRVALEHASAARFGGPAAPRPGKPGPA